MFGDAGELWFPVDHATRLRDQPKQVHLAGQAIALFRDRHGTAHALIDRCPHRGVALSLGKVRGDCLECPFHGWQFAGDGSCTHVPFNADAKRERLGAVALPTVERGGLIWVFTGEHVPDDRAEPQVPDALLRSDLRRHVQEEAFEAHWTRVMENMLDVPHLPWVHGRSIGMGMRTDVRLELDIDPRPHGFELRWTLGDEPQPANVPPPWLQWWMPCGMVLSIDNPFGHYRQHVFCVPGSPGQTRMLIVTTRKYALGIDRLIWPALKWFERRVLFEDKAVIESSDPPATPPAADERSVATDEPTLRFRKWYWQRRRANPPTGLVSLDLARRA